LKLSLKIATAICLIAVLLTVTLLPAAAVTPVYEFSREYKSSAYYDNLLAYVPTGDMRYDVLAVAFTQQGYHEGDRDADMHGGNANGSRNYVEYNRMYGPLDNGEGNGVSYGYHWCAAFVSWCLRHSGVPEEVAVTEVSCNRMLQWYRQNGTYHARQSGYTPLPGDLILFHDGSGIPHHVGLVLGVNGGRVHVIDGNGKEDNVATHVYHHNSAKILGYCVPDYTTRAGTVYDFLPEAQVIDPVTVTLSATVVALIAAVGGFVVLRVMRKQREALMPTAPENTAQNGDSEVSEKTEKPTEPAKKE